MARELAGLSQAHLAEQVGVSAAAISQFESGAARPSPETLDELGATLEVPTGFFDQPLMETHEGFFRSLRRTAVTDRRRARAVAYVAHDLAAHATGWMEQAVRELRSGEFASWTAETIQAFNDRSVRAHQLVGPEAMLDELDSAHRRLRSAVAALIDEELADPKRFGMVGAYTFLHWEHHFAELGIPT